MDKNISILYVTFPDEDHAIRIGRILLQEKSIACINFFPVRSLYTWQGKTEDGKEFVAFVKTSTEKTVETVNRIKELHPYSTPCILQKTWEANDEYFFWLGEVTGENKPGRLT